MSFSGAPGGRGSSFTARIQPRNGSRCNSLPAHPNSVIRERPVLGCGSSGLEQRDGAFSAVGADADDRAGAGGPRSELLDSVAQDPGAGRSERVADRDAAAPGIDAVPRERAEG